MSRVAVSVAIRPTQRAPGVSELPASSAAAREDVVAEREGQSHECGEPSWRQPIAPRHLAVCSLVADLLSGMSPQLTSAADISP